MKFIPTKDGTFVNVDHIQAITVGFFGEDMVSSLIDTQGKPHPFLELPRAFEDEDGNDIKIEKHHIEMLHEAACDVMCKEFSGAYDLETFSDKVWERFHIIYKQREETEESDNSTYESHKEMLNSLLSSLEGWKDRLSSLQKR